MTPQLKCHVTFWVGPHHLGTMNLVNMQTKRFDLTRDLVIDVSRDFVGPLILSHQSAKFGVHRPCESGNITFFMSCDLDIEVPLDFVVGVPTS